MFRLVSLSFLKGDAAEKDLTVSVRCLSVSGRSQHEGTNQKLSGPTHSCHRCMMGSRFTAAAVRVSGVAFTADMKPQRQTPPEAGRDVSCAFTGEPDGESRSCPTYVTLCETPRGVILLLLHHRRHKYSRWLSISTAETEPERRRRRRRSTEVQKQPRSSVKT